MLGTANEGSATFRSQPVQRTAPTLSQARAEAVKQVLTSEYGVKPDPLTAKGYGGAKPSGDNKTPEGRANNRRVELVKM